MFFKHYLALSPFEAANSNISIQLVFRGLRVCFFVVYEIFKLRKKGRNRSGNYFLTKLGVQAMKFKSCKGYFPPAVAFETSL